MNPYTIESTARILTHGGSPTPTSLEAVITHLETQDPHAWHLIREHLKDTEDLYMILETVNRIRERKFSVRALVHALLALDGCPQSVHEYRSHLRDEETEEAPASVSHPESL